MKTRLLVALLLMCAMAGAQVVEMQSQIDRRGAQPDEAKTKPSAEQLQRGHQMLENAEAAAGGMEGGMRAYALLQIARAYSTDNKKKALSLLDEALSLTRGIEDDNLQTRERLQEQILQAIVPLAPKRADQLLNDVEPRARGKVLTSLLSYYERSNELDRAIQVVYQIAAEQEVPYDAVGRLMQRLTAGRSAGPTRPTVNAAEKDTPRVVGDPVVGDGDAGAGAAPKPTPSMPVDRAADVQQLFATALASYRDHLAQAQSGRMAFGSGDFTSLITQNWKLLPRETVLDAIHEVLNAAQKQAQQQSGSGAPQGAAIAMSTPNGGVSFGSIYEFRLFQLLPALKQLDPSEAEKRVKESQTLTSLAQKYPDGMNSLSPPQQAGANASPRSNMSMSVQGPPRGAGGGSGSGSGSGRPPGGGLPNPMAMQQVQKVVADAEKHPDDALANAAAISDPNLRAEAYMGIAQANAKKNASASKQALEKVTDLLGEMDIQRQVTVVSSAAKLYLDMDDTGSARKLIEKGMTIADKAYKQDTNADDPNKALKAYWPSAEAYRGMLRLAGRISPTWAMELLKDISDPEMKGIGQIALAEAWLDVPGGQRTVISSTKNGTMMQMSRE